MEDYRPSPRPSTRYGWLAFACLYMSGCATVVRGTSEDFQVATNPAGARVTTTLEMPSSRKARQKNPDLLAQNYGCAATPCAIKVPRRSTFIAKVEKTGYQTVRVIVRPSGTKTAKIADGVSMTSPSKAVAAGTVIGDTALVGASITAASALTYGLAETVAAPYLATGLSGFSIFYAPAFIAVDAASGSMLSLYPNPVALILIRDGELLPKGYAVRTVEQSRALLMGVE